MRTVGRRVDRGTRSVALCDYCGTRWPREKLYRDGAGLLTCPQEGRGRDAVTLTKDSVAAAKAAAEKHVPHPGDPGRYDKDPVDGEDPWDVFGSSFT